MKAMYINAPGEVEIKEIDMPVRKEGEVLLKLLYGGICGSDLGSYRGTFAYFDYPRIPGHEFSGQVVQTGENADVKWQNKQNTYMQNIKNKIFLSCIC